MALIDLVNWKPKSSEYIIAYRYPQNNLSTGTQLIVNESQEALFFSKGKLMGKFGPGKHTLSTENLPLLRSLYGIPFGGKNPFMAEVWVVNKLLPANLPWSIDRMTIHDPDFETQLPLTASGQYGLKVVDSERFLINMVGTKELFTEQDLADQAKGEFTTKSKSAIMKFMIQNRVGFKQISAYIDDISAYLLEAIRPFWETYGLELTKYYVSTIELDTSTQDGRDIRDAIAKQAAMKLTGHTWQQEQAFNLANNTVGQMGQMGQGGGGGGLLGSLMALNMMNNMSGSMGGSMMQSQYGQPGYAPQGGPAPQQAGQQPVMPQQTAAVKTIFCANCGKKRLSSERFCPNCGAEYNPCPRCGADNAKSARRCVSCGAPLQSGGGTINVCPTCGNPLTPGAAFCPSCGTPVGHSNQNACPRCGSSITPGVSFCPTCGYKIK